MSFLQCSLMALASQSSNPRIDFGNSMRLVNDKRIDLAKATFPYIKQDKHDSAEASSTVSTKDYESYFDRLDALAAMKAKANGKMENKDGASVGDNVDK